MFSISSIANQISLASKLGCSNAAKCPPIGISEALTRFIYLFCKSFFMPNNKAKSCGNKTQAAGTLTLALKPNFK